MNNVAHCTYRQTYNLIHEFTLTSNSHEAVDDYIDLACQLAETLPPTGPIFLMVIFPKGRLPSLAYMSQRGLEAYRKTQALGRVIIALVVDSAESQIAENFFPILGAGTTRAFFEHAEKEKATAWLLNRAEILIADALNELLHV